MTLNDSNLDDPASRLDLNATLRQIANDSPQLEEELLAERIELAGEAYLERALTPTLSELIDAVPLLRSRPLAMDAAIDAVLRCLLAQGLSLQAADARLRQDTPEFTDEIDAHMALRSILSSSRSDSISAHPKRTSLPAPFGPILKNGRQRYELVEFMGRGSEGSVFRAFDRYLTADGRPSQVAVKQLFERGPESTSRVSEEAARALRVRHTTIAALLSCGDSDECPFLVYEFIDGEPLDRWRRTRGNVDAHLAAEIIIQLADGIQAAHNVGVVHRDLKPNNILLRYGRDPYITDFGLAEAMSQSSDCMSGGSLAFAAPEQIAGSYGSKDATVDIYALGGILWWLLTGKYPNGESVEIIRSRLLSNDLKPRVESYKVRRHERTLYRICEKALAIEPHDRYSSAGLLATDLARWLAHEPVLPFDNTMFQRTTLAVKRSPVVATVMCGAAIVFLAVLGYGWKLDINQRQLQFAMERERLEQQINSAQVIAEEQQRRIDNAGTLVKGFIQVLKSTQTRTGDVSWLPVLTAVESLSGPNMLAIPSLGDDLVESRISVVTELLTQADITDTRDTIEMVMWETALGYWLLSDRQYDNARSVLDINRERVARVFPAKDPWVMLVTALRNVAIIETQPDSSMAEDARDWMRAHHKSLPTSMQRLVTNALS